MHILAEFTPLDPATGLRVTLRAASAQDRTITGLNGQRWWPAILKKPSLGLRLFDGDFTSPIDPGSASFDIALDGLEKLVSNARSLLWAGAFVTLYAGDTGQAWPWAKVFTGIVDTFQAKANKLSLVGKVDTTPFDANVLTAIYAGTGGAEGGADLKGQVKPLIFGQVFNAEPVLVDAVNSVYQFSGYGAIEAVDALYERGSDFGASVGDFATYAALVAATVPAGKWATCLATGMIRLGAPAYGVITGDVLGDNVGGYRDLTGEILIRAAAIAGVDSGRIVATNFAEMDTACPYPVGIYLTEQASVMSLARRMSLPLNAQAGVSWLGQLFATRLSIASPTLTLDGQGRRMPPVQSLTETDVSPPYKRIVFGAARAWRVQTLEEIAYYAPLIDLGDYDSSETYREGNIVQDQDSSWLYINPAPTSGIAPPTLPTTSNSYWKVMAKGGSGTPGYSNALVYLFQRGTSAPAVPTATLTYTFATGVLSGGSLAGWSQSLPSGTDPLYVTAASASSTGATDTIATGEWASPIVQAGAGTNGLNAATVYLYQRGTTAPAVPTATLTYTFATGVLAGGSLAGWSQTVPSGTDPIWVTTGTAISSGATDTIATGEWATPNILAQNGTVGPNGYSAAQILLFQRGATAPAVPSATLTYTFATDALTGSLSGWSRSPPAADGNPLYVIAASASSNTASDTIATGEWSSPVIQAQDGGTGTAGLNVATVFLYKRATSAPSVPGSTTTFTFATGILSGTLSGWSQSLPSGTDPVYYTTATAVSGGTTDTIATGEWASPNILAQNGSDGSPGVSPKLATLSTYTVAIAADAANATKTGQLPRSVTVSLTQAGSSILGAASVSLTPSDSGAIAASYSAGTISITQADAIGYIDVQVTHASVVVDTLRLAITRPRDPAAPQSQSSGSSEITGTLSGTSVQIIGAAVTIKANGSGELSAAWGADYDAQGSTSVRNFKMGGYIAYRAAGSGTWSYTTEQLGSTATTPASGDPVPGSISVGGAASLTSLTAGAYYEVAPAARMNTGTSGAVANIAGSFTVSQ